MILKKKKDLDSIILIRKINVNPEIVTSSDTNKSFEIITSDVVDIVLLIELYTRRTI